MFRRTFAVAAAAASVVLVPGAASAAPDGTPAKNTFSAGYSVSGQVVLPDGRQATFLLEENRGASKDGWTASLNLSTWTYRDCDWMQCQDNLLTGWAVLDADDVHFSRNLSGAGVTGIPIRLQTWSGPGAPVDTDQEEVLVSIRFDGVGAVSRDVYHGDLCGDGVTACQAKRLESAREAQGTVTVGGQTVSTSATIRYVQSNETAPKPAAGSEQPPPPPGGYPPPPPPPGGDVPVPPPGGFVPVPPPGGYLPPLPGGSVPPLDGGTTGAPQGGATS